MVGDHSRQMKTQICTVGDIGVRRRPSAMDFAHYQSPKLLGSSPLSQINTASLENLGQTSGECPIYRQNLGWSAKSKIPDGLGFSRHMKTRLNRVHGGTVTKATRIAAENVDTDDTNQTL